MAVANSKWQNKQNHNGDSNFQGSQHDNLNVCHNHAVLHTPHDNSNPQSIQTHSKVHYLYIVKTICKYIAKYSYLCMHYINCSYGIWLKLL